jgi:hypothetical protein
MDNTSDANKPVSAAAQTALDLKANLRPTFTGTVSGIDKQWWVYQMWIIQRCEPVSTAHKRFRFKAQLLV